MTETTPIIFRDRLTFGEERVMIDSFSRVEVVYNQKVEVFDYEEQSLAVYENVTGFCNSVVPDPLPDGQHQQDQQRNHHDKDKLRKMPEPAVFFVFFYGVN